MMEKFHEEEKGLGEKIDRIAINSLEEKVSRFFDGDSSSDGSSSDADFEEFESEDRASHDPEERTAYWEAQDALLQEVLERSNATGSKMRQEIDRVIETTRNSDFCLCLNPNPNHCIRCLRRGLVNSLRDKGFNSKLCISKWRNTRRFPGGEHEYVEVAASTKSGKTQMLFIVELEFRDQFEIVKASDEYRHLVGQLPGCFIGKREYLNAIVRVVCEAAKRSMKENKIYMGPWRKRSFMQMKWSGSGDWRWHLDESFNKLQSAKTCLQWSASPAAVTVS